MYAQIILLLYECAAFQVHQIEYSILMRHPQVSYVFLHTDISIGEKLFWTQTPDNASN